MNGVEDVNRNPEVEATPLAYQVAGHSALKDSNDLGLLSMKGGFVLKPLQKPKLGRREAEFYESLVIPMNLVSKDLSLFIPKYHGTRELWVKDRRIEFLVLSDISHGYIQPCLMDIKIGRQTWDPNAGQDKINAEVVKYRASKRELGFCIPGFQVYDASSGELKKFDSAYGKALDGDGVREALRTFLNGHLAFSRSLLLQFLAKLWHILRWFRSQKNYHFFGSSILLAYDCVKLRENIKNGVRKVNGVVRPTIGRQLSLRESTGPLTPGYESSQQRSPSSSRPGTPNSPDWHQVFDNVCKTHSLENNYDKDLQSMKQNYSVVLKDLLEDRGTSANWADVKMIDFAHVFKANSVDKNYLEGLENLVNIFEQFLLEADS